MINATAASPKTQSTYWGAHWWETGKAERSRRQSGTWGGAAKWRGSWDVNYKLVNSVRYKRGGGADQPRSRITSVYRCGLLS